MGWASISLTLHTRGKPQGPGTNILSCGGISLQGMRGVAAALLQPWLGPRKEGKGCCHTGAWGTQTLPRSGAQASVIAAAAAAQGSEPRAAGACNTPCLGTLPATGRGAQGRPGHPPLGRFAGPGRSVTAGPPLQFPKQTPSDGRMLTQGVGGHSEEAGRKSSERARQRARRASEEPARAQGCVEDPATPAKRMEVQAGIPPRPDNMLCGARRLGRSLQSGVPPPVLAGGQVHRKAGTGKGLQSCGNPRECCTLRWGERKRGGGETEAQDFQA